jgi:nucleoside 2-deoxyribosyltransferase
VAKRLFIAFAVEDKSSRDLLKGQEVLAGSPIDYVDMSAKEPWSEDWKTNCRSRIRGCDGVIALLSRNTLSAAGAKWEIGCAVNEKKPLLGVYIHKNDKSKPSEMGAASCIE